MHLDFVEIQMKKGLIFSSAQIWQNINSPLSDMDLYLFKSIIPPVCSSLSV